MIPDDERVCLLCGPSKHRTIVYPRRAVNADSLLHFTHIEICNKCNLGTAIPKSDQAVLSSFYESGKYWSCVGDNLPQSMHEKIQVELRISICNSCLNKNKAFNVLDVGSGHGWTVDWLAKTFPGQIARFDFIEPDERRAAEISHKQTSFLVNRIINLEKIDTTYDLILLNHILEHVADPVSLVKRVSELLTPEGIAYIEIPHSDYRFKDDVFPHTLFFTPASLAALGRIANVEEVLCEEFGRWPAPGLVTYVLQIAFTISARFRGLWWLQRQLDYALWRYRRAAPGIWLRWIIRKR